MVIILSWCIVSFRHATGAIAPIPHQCERLLHPANSKGHIQSNGYIFTVEGGRTNSSVAVRRSNNNITDHESLKPDNVDRSRTESKSGTNKDATAIHKALRKLPSLLKGNWMLPSITTVCIKYDMKSN